MLLNSLNSCVNPWIYLFFNQTLVQTLRQQLSCCPGKTVNASTPSTATGGDLTTQGTDASNNTLSLRGSPVAYASPQKTPETCAGNQEHQSSQKVDLLDKIEMTAVPSRTTAELTAWRGDQLYGERVNSCEELLDC